MISRSLIPEGNKKCSRSGMDAELIDGRSEWPRPVRQSKEGRGPQGEGRNIPSMEFNVGLRSTGAGRTLILKWCARPPLMDA